MDIFAFFLNQKEHFTETFLSRRNILQDASTSVRNEVTSCLRVYEKHSDAISIQDATAPHPFWPPIAVMLRHLVFIDRLVHDDFIKKEHYVKSIVYTDLPSAEALQKAWKPDRKLEQKVNDVLTLVDFLLKETF